MRRRPLPVSPSGAYVINSRRGAHACTATVRWVSQASARPPLLMVAVAPHSELFRCLSESGAATLHASDQPEEGMQCEVERIFDIEGDHVLAILRVVETTEH